MQNPTQQKRKFTTFERDVNNRDEAQQRGYSAWFSRFDQPDPYDGSYDLTDPQSLNRYAYTQGDPVNFVDPSGLLLAPFVTSFCRNGDCYSYLRWDSISGFGGSGLDPFDSSDPGAPLLQIVTPPAHPELPSPALSSSSLPSSLAPAGCSPTAAPHAGTTSRTVPPARIIARG